MKTIIYSRRISKHDANQAELLADLRQAIEHRGNTVVATFTDDPRIRGKGKFSGWRALVAGLDGIEQVVVSSASDLPGKTAGDLLKILATLRYCGIGLSVRREGINTNDGAAAIIDLIAFYRAAKRSEAIRRGISKARDRGKILGRPAVPAHVRQQIQMALMNSGGIRSTARKFNVSPGTVINVRQMMDAETGRQAA
jgi:DNA invertase Pin-like site-specific DNA recombinase